MIWSLKWAWPWLLVIIQQRKIEDSFGCSPRKSEGIWHKMTKWKMQKWILHDLSSSWCLALAGICLFILVSSFELTNLLPPKPFQNQIFSYKRCSKTFRGTVRVIHYSLLQPGQTKMAVLLSEFGTDVSKVAKIMASSGGGGVLFCCRIMQDLILLFTRPFIYQLLLLHRDTNFPRSPNR